MAEKASEAFERGKEMNVKFYRCNHCGNIAVKVVDSGVPLVCCGEEMELLVPDTQDAALEKHVPDVTVDGRKVRVQIGSVEHPMVDDHYIQFICLVTDNSYQIHPLTSDNEPRCEFTLGEEEIPKEVYEYCNVHGLWKKNL